VLISP